jgi:hypothetical protein
MFDNMQRSILNRMDPSACGKRPSASGRRCFVPDATKPSIPDGTAVLHALCHAEVHTQPYGPLRLRQEAHRLRQEVHHV